MLYFENVSTFYGKIQALHNVNVEVRKGEIVTLIGANGAGKSTLLMTLCGTPMASEGSIRFEGEELVGKHVYVELWVKVNQKWRRKAGFVQAQGYGL